MIDVDPRHGGNASISNLEGEHDLLPTTLTCRTGGSDGGLHLWFRRLSRAIRISPSVATRSPRTRPPELPAGGHEISRGHQLRGATPLPELAWARRTLSPVVATKGTQTVIA
ncbi:MAG: bifunctional DNA primase/polymerase [Actinomycetota bacterium]|nr:bifunctional DNA primase/polymerase [Actinomycetota bacterium]